MCDVCAVKPKPFLEVVDGVLHIHPHPKQQRVFESKAKRILVLAGRQSGKCHREGTKVVLAGGERKNIENIKHGDVVESLDDTFKIVESRVSHRIDSGSLPVYEIETTSGRRIETSETHPFLTNDGWKEVGDMSIKDFIAVPRSLPIEGDGTYDTNTLKLIGYLLGDGGISQGSVLFSNIDEHILADIESAVPPSCTFKHAERCTYRIVGNTHSKNDVLEYLRNIGMMGHTAHTKSIPEFIFKLKNEYIAIVINRLFACDGWVDTSGIGYCSVSKQLMYDVQHLLLRFGIVSRVRHRYTNCNGKTFPSYSMSIKRKSDMIRFQQHVGIFSKDDKLNALIESKKIEVPNDLVPYNTDALYTKIKRIGKSNRVQRIDKKKYKLLRGARTNNIERHKLKSIADEFDDDYLKNLANSDIFWDRIKKIEYIGEHQCYDLEIDNTHNFIANDIFTHNTVCGPIWMYNEILDWDEKVQEDSVVSDAAFLAISPSFPLLDKKLLPTYYEYLVNMLGVANYKVQKKVFEVKIKREDNTSAKYDLFLESAQNEGSLASVTAAGIHFDEIAMDSISLKGWNEVEGRVGSTGGRILGTTTIYGWNWVRRLLYDPWVKGSDRIEVIRFESIDNPFFDKDMWENLKRTLPTWQFNMEYRGIYDRPAGRIYDQFDVDKHVVKQFDIPMSVDRFVGIDPGLVNHATSWVAEIKNYEQEYEHFPLADGVNSVFVVYRTSLVGSTSTTKSNEEHAHEAMAQPDFSAVRRWFGGSRSEKYFRADYLKAGIIVEEPAYTEVEAGISSLYKIMAQDRFYVMDNLHELYEPPISGEDYSIPAYSRKLDEYGHPTSVIKNKSEWHLLDTLRYIFVGIDAIETKTISEFVTMSGKSFLDV